MNGRGNASNPGLSGGSGPSSPNVGQSLLDRINLALGKKRQLSVSSGKNDGKWTDTDSNSDIDDEVSLLECAKIAKLSNNVKDNYGCRGMNEGRKQIKNTHTHSAVPVLTIDDDDDDDDEDGDEPNELDLNRDQLIPDTPGSFYCLPNEIESPAIKASVKPNNQVVRSKGEHSTEASVKSGSSSKSILMEGLSFSKDNKKEVASISKNASKKTREEKELEKIEKRKAKELAKQAKDIAKQEEKQKKLDEKEAKKKKQDQEKNAKKASSMTAKADSIDQCLKYVTAVLDSDVLTDGGGAILQSLESMSVQYEVKKLPCHSTIGWMRDRVEYSAEESGQIKRNSSYEEEDQILMRIKAADLAKMIDSGATAADSMSNLTLTDHVAKAKRLLPKKKITIIVTGMESYSKLVKAKSALKKKQQLLPNISKTDLEDALLQLEFQHNCCVHFCESAEELAQLVCSFTKAVAEKPYKKTCGVAFNVYMNNHEKGLPRVTKDGQGLLEVWVRQLQQFRGVGYDTAAAIVQKYPSPNLLIQGYNKCSSSLEASLHLQDIEVRRGHGVLATSRRVGPELSKKVHTLLMSTDGHTEVGKS